MKAEAERRHAETLELIHQQNVTWKQQMADEANARVDAETRRSDLEANRFQQEAMRTGSCVCGFKSSLANWWLGVANEGITQGKQDGS